MSTLPDFVERLRVLPVGSCFQNRQKQDVSVGAPRDGFTAFLKTTCDGKHPAELGMPSNERFFAATPCDLSRKSGN